MIDQFTLTRLERGFFVGRLMRGGLGAGAAIEADAALMGREGEGARRWPLPLRKTKARFAARCV